MTPRPSRKPKLSNLTTGRPPHHRYLHKTKPSTPHSLSSQKTRTLIRTYHTLNKSRVAALASGNLALAAHLAAQLEAQGGLDAYQVASRTGQKPERGGDSSVRLVEWVRGRQGLASSSLKKEEEERDSRKKFRLLEVGCLSMKNACSMCGLFDVERIDLKAQEKGILQQDFMERPLPPPREGAEEEEGWFDFISLSLVLNYVPDAEGRGEMLRRTTRFLRARRQGGKHSEGEGEGEGGFFPALFLVLPAPCVTNSRYFTEGRLSEIMTSLGYVMLERKITNKLAYYLWRFDDMATSTPTPIGTRKFKKEEINPGGKRNNFAVVLA
ncbi:MAG: hypothetical protein M1834_000423 [Cirrosporium novae-zelandiae]|nr:MAG: hypothetical protein M1834_000423 [Cirrosporium novae-zelandiae]